MTSTATSHLARLAILLLLPTCGGVIHGRVFVDTNRDGLRQPDEPGVPGVAVFFERVERTRADAAGDYILATPYPLGIVWAWTPAGFRPGPSYAHVLDADAEVDIPVVPADPSSPSDPDAPWTFVVTSDTHLVMPEPGQRWDGGDVRAALAQALVPAPTPPRFFTILGDITQGARPPEIESIAATLGAIATPFAPVAGNHDLYDAGHAWRIEWGPDGYAFDTGGVRVVVWNAFLDDQLQLDFLHLVLDGEDPTARIIGFGHASPRDRVAAEMAALGIDTLFTGHWHASRRVDRFGLVEWGTEPLIMGGLDQTPGGYRVVTVDHGRLTTAARTTLHAPVLAIASPRGCAGEGRVDVIAVAAIDAAAPVVRAAWADAPTRRIQLDPWGGWAYRGTLPAIGGASRELVVTAGSLERRATVERCPPREAPSGGEWAQLQGSAAHTGAIDDTIANLAPAWTTAVGGHVLTGSPIVADGTIYVTTTDLADGDHGGVVALALDTGRERWRVVTGRPARSAVAVGGGVVIVADSGGLVRALETATGHERWRHDLAAGTDSWTWAVWQPPTIVDDTVLIATQARFVALDLATGVPRWTRAFDRPAPWLGSSAAATPVGSEVMFVPDREDGLWLGDAATGTERLAIPSVDFLGIDGAPVADGDSVYIGNSNGNVLALDPAMLGVRWRTPIVDGGNDWSASIVGNLAVHAGRVFVPTQAGDLVALDATTGAVLWRHRTARGPINAIHYASDGVGYAASPVVTGDRVWIGGPDGVLVALDVATGAERERHELGAPILAGVAPVDGGLVVATFAGTVHLLAAPPPPPPPFPWVVLPGALIAFVIGTGLARIMARSRTPRSRRGPAARGRGSTRPSSPAGR